MTKDIHVVDVGKMGLPMALRAAMAQREYLDDDAADMETVERHAGVDTQ